VNKEVTIEEEQQQSSYDKTQDFQE